MTLEVAGTALGPFESIAQLSWVRAMVQLTLYERLREARPELEALFVERLES